MITCLDCFTKQVVIDQLEAENLRLKAALKYQETKAQKGFFGGSTPSSRLPVKSNTTAKVSARKRGAQTGHPAHVRRGAVVTEGGRVVEVPSAFDGVCPRCGGRLMRKDTRRRRVRECWPIRAEDLVLELPVERCSTCCCDQHTPAPGVLPKGVLGNQLVTNAIEMAYLHGIPLGRICEQLGVQPGVLVAMFHRLAKLFEGVPGRLVELYRQTAVKHADETGWRTQGKNGYAWLFATSALSIFRFEKTRSGRVAHEVFGKEKLPGVLVVDRYNGYNKAPCEIQYCLAHLLRAVQNAEREFPDCDEVKSFVGTVAPLLALAIGLRSQSLSDEEFQKRSTETAAQLKQAMRRPAVHLAIKHLQRVFIVNEQRLYHWARDRLIPAENNLAERDLRPTVIARKTSFGSQSDAGAKTRGVLMTVLHTLKKQGANPVVHFKRVLDQLARDSTLDPFPLLFPAFGPA